MAFYLFRVFFFLTKKHFLAKVLALSHRKTNIGIPRVLKVRTNMLLLISASEEVRSACTFTAPAYNQLAFNEVLTCLYFLKTIKIITIMQK